jgi:signal peptidase I
MKDERAAVEIALAEEVLRTYGKLRIVARGSSMIPTIYPGDILLVEHDPLGRLLPGDVVLASRANRFFAHRVVRLTALGGKPRIITRGDALAENDPPFLDDEVLGRVTALVRGEKRIELAGQEDLERKKLLQWAVQHSDGVAAGLLWYRSLVEGISEAPGKAQTRTKLQGRLAECL